MNTEMYDSHVTI